VTGDLVVPKDLASNFGDRAPEPPTFSLRVELYADISLRSAFCRSVEPYLS